MDESEKLNESAIGPWIGYCNTCGHVERFGNWGALSLANCGRCGAPSDGNGYCWCEGCMREALLAEGAASGHCAVCGGVPGAIYDRARAYLGELKIGVDGCCQFCTIDKRS